MRLVPLKRSILHATVCTFLLALPGAVWAQADSALVPPPYKQLRYLEDYGYLRDRALRADLWDYVKYVPLSDSGQVYLSLGGEARERYEYFHNWNWGEGPQDNNGYLLQRYMLHADLRLGDHVRLFGQLKSGLEDGRTGGPRPPDRDALDLNQAFVDLSFMPSDGSLLVIRAGRQEMAYGSSRLVSVREGPNVRQSFDGARMTVRATGWNMDGFITRPVETKTGVFDDGADFDRSFWGVYATGPFRALPAGNVDIYYLGLDKANAQFDQGTAHEHRHSVGTRLWGGEYPVDYNFEFVYQWGTFGAGDIQAWTAASDIGYTFGNLPLSPRLGLKADIISGDRNPGDPDLETFNPLFPKGSYFNEMQLIGPVNLVDLHPSVDIHPWDTVTITLDWDFFWRESDRDGLYNTGAALVRSGQETDKRYIGSALTLEPEWKLDRHLTLVAAYTHFFAGPFLSQSGPGKDVDFLAAWASYLF